MDSSFIKSKRNVSCLDAGLSDLAFCSFLKRLNKVYILVLPRRASRICTPPLFVTYHLSSDADSEYDRDISFIRQILIARIPCTHYKRLLGYFCNSILHSYFSDEALAPSGCLGAI